MILLREVGLVESESCGDYLRFARPTLLTRRADGVVPSHVIAENSNLIRRGIHRPIRTLWCDFRAPELAGDPPHRKIGPQEATDSAQQGIDGAIRDFAYTIRRPPHLTPGDGRSRFDAAYTSLSDDV